MKQEHIDALSALMDGEPCEPGLLAESLAQPDAAEVLADFAALRVLARDGLGVPSDAFYRTMAKAFEPQGRLRRLAPGWRGLGVAASFVLMAFAAGYWAAPGSPSLPYVSPPTVGRSVGSRPTLPYGVMPPAAAIEVRGAAGRGGVGAASNTGAGRPQPVLRMRFTEWRDTSEQKAPVLARLESSDGQN
jgi:hypothetical protein